MRHPLPPAPPRATGGQLGSTLGRVFISLRNHDFRYLTLGTLATGFSQWAEQIALGWLVFLLTGSAVQLGTVAFVGGVLSVAVTPFGGVIADRYPRRTIILWATLAGSAQAFALALLVVSGRVQVWHAYAFALLSSLTTAINLPARQAYVFDASNEETLTNAVAVNSIAQNLSRVMGPPLAGVLAIASVATPFIFVAAARGVATLATLRMSRLPARADRPPTAHPLREVLDGFRYLLSDRRLTGLLLLTGLPSLLVYPYVSFLPIFAENVLHGGSVAYGLLAAMVGLGSLIGLLGLAFLGEIGRQGRWIVIGLLAYLTLVIGFTQSTYLPLSLGLLVAAGVANGSQLALNASSFQRGIRDDMRGRGMAAWQMARSLAPFGALPMGLLIALIGVQLGAAVFVTACLAIVAAIALTWRSLREL